MGIDLDTKRVAQVFAIEIKSSQNSLLNACQFHANGVSSRSFLNSVGKQKQEIAFQICIWKSQKCRGTGREDSGYGQNVGMELVRVKVKAT